MARPPLKRRAKAPSTPLWQRMRANFLTGLVLVVPFALTVWLLWTAIAFVDSRVLPLIPSAYKPTFLGRNIFGFGLVVFIIFTTFVGGMAKGLFGRQLIRTGEGLLERTPVVRSIYSGLKQIVETVLAQNGTSFQKAVLIEYPRKGLWALAFVATDAKGELPGKLGRDDMLSVFLPTTPNPTSGFLLFVPRSEMIELDMTVEEAAKLVISAGLVTPPSPEQLAAAAAAAAPPRRPQKPVPARIG